jgi:hypothetical protein
MSKYAWIITKDVIDNGERNGTFGPRGADKPKPGQGTKFRVKDDDGEIYAYGWFVGDADSEEAFSPLDDFAEPYWGCTTIEYKNTDGVYEIL